MMLVTHFEDISCCRRVDEELFGSYKQLVWDYAEVPHGQVYARI